jgi:hypothetical protein
MKNGIVGRGSERFLPTLFAPDTAAARRFVEFFTAQTQLAPR